MTKRRTRRTFITEFIQGAHFNSLEQLRPELNDYVNGFKNF